jgi:hypothetical protein
MKIIYDDLFEWEGWGGKLRLGSGKCRLRILNLRSETTNKLTPIKPVVVIVSDIPGGAMSVRSCAGHIATQVTCRFNIDPHRMLYVEYYPAVVYGGNKKLEIPERYESVEFTWREDKAIQPRWRPLPEPLVEMIESVMAEK